MQNVFQNFINKNFYVSYVLETFINSETARFRLLKFLPEMENYKKTQNMQKKLFASGMTTCRFCKMTAAQQSTKLVLIQWIVSKSQL